MQKLAIDLARAGLRYLVQEEGTAIALKKVGRREKGARRIGAEAIGKKASCSLRNLNDANLFAPA